MPIRRFSSIRTSRWPFLLGFAQRSPGVNLATRKSIGWPFPCANAESYLFIFCDAKHSLRNDCFSASLTYQGRPRIERRGSTHSRWTGRRGHHRRLSKIPSSFALFWLPNAERRACEVLRTGRERRTAPFFPTSLWPASLRLFAFVRRAALVGRLEVVMGRGDHAHVHAHAARGAPRPGLARPGAAAARSGRWRASRRPQRATLCCRPRSEEPLLTSLRCR